MKKYLIVIVLFTLLISCNENQKIFSKAEHGQETKFEQLKGPHGGKYFEDNNFGIEVTIYEPEIPPQSRVYVFENGKQIDPTLVTLVTELHRIDRVDTIQYKKQDDYLQGDLVVEEPHSFDVKLNAIYKGKEYKWSYSSYEGRTILSNEAIKSTGIKVEKVSGGKIKTTVTLNGKVVPDKLRISKLTARFPGIIKEIKKVSGDKVEKGEVIAVIESNQSLISYNLTSPHAGEILALSASVGENVDTFNPIARVGDLSSIWVELSVPRSEFTTIKLGQKVFVQTENNKSLEGEVTFLSSVADGDSQTRLARAVMPNKNMELIPDLFVEADVVIKEREVPVVVKVGAIQKFRDWDVVFKKVGQNFEIAILELGEEDGDFIEIKAGLLPGTEYVTENSFVVKADVMKSSASHDH